MGNNTKRVAANKKKKFSKEEKREIKNLVKECIEIINTLKNKK